MRGGGERRGETLGEGERERESESERREGEAPGLERGKGDGGGGGTQARWWHRELTCGMLAGVDVKPGRVIPSPALKEAGVVSRAGST